jgi:hypothetical protein
MADEDTGGEGAENTGTDAFDPKSLSPEAQEYIRRKAQSDSDAKTAAEMSKFRAEQARSARSAVESAEERELKQLAESGQHEALGQRVAARLANRSAEEQVVFRVSDAIEAQMKEAFTESLGPEKVEEVHREVLEKGGAHAEFAMGLAAAHDSKTRQEEIQAEVKAQLAEARGEKRDATSGADRATGGGQGPPPEGFDKIEQEYIDGNLVGGRKAYEAAMEARDKGK